MRKIIITIEDRKEDGCTALNLEDQMELEETASRSENIIARLMKNEFLEMFKHILPMAYIGQAIGNTREETEGQIKDIIKVNRSIRDDIRKAGDE